MFGVGSYLVRANFTRMVHRQCARRFSSCQKTSVTDPAVNSVTESTNAVDGLIESKDGEIQYVVSREDFVWVKRLFPPSLVPMPPKHDSYPTPSGWVAPSETVPDKPYFIPRNRLHVLPITEVQKPKHGNRWLTIIRHIQGDIMALEKELVEVVRPNLDFDPVTRVHEAAQTIWIKGVHKDTVERYLYQLGF